METPGLEKNNGGGEENIDDDTPQVRETSKVVETSPKGRYVRFNLKLGEGAFKKVYKAWDSVDGHDVAWNTIRIGSLNDAGKLRVFHEMQILNQLKHPNIIKFYSSWISRETSSVVFITELITSGTLKEFIQQRPIRVRTVKRWCHQILDALNYLHTMEPPVIHRDLKCDNIFVNGSTSEIRIGDLGLASWSRAGGAAMSVLGTPEYMAPELYEENYDKQVDIYAFGMCVLEMISKETPYQECNSAAQIYKKVTAGILPGVYHRMKEGEFKEFIYSLIHKRGLGEQRPTASELLRHPVLEKTDADDVDTSVMCEHLPVVDVPSDEIDHHGKGVHPSPRAQKETSFFGSLKQDEDGTLVFSEEDGNNGTPAQQQQQQQQQQTGSIPAVTTSSMRNKVHFTANATIEESQATHLGQWTLRSKRTKESHIFVLELSRMNENGKKTVFKFDFDLENEQAADVASEIISELQVPMSEMDDITMLLIGFKNSPHHDEDDESSTGAIASSAPSTDIEPSLVAAPLIHLTSESNGAPVSPKSSKSADLHDFNGTSGGGGRSLAASRASSSHLTNDHHSCTHFIHDLAPQSEGKVLAIDDDDDFDVDEADLEEDLLRLEQESAEQLQKIDEDVKKEMERFSLLVSEHEERLKVLQHQREALEKEIENSKKCLPETAATMKHQRHLISVASKIAASVGEEWLKRAIESHN